MNANKSIENKSAVESGVKVVETKSVETKPVVKSNKKSGGKKSDKAIAKVETKKAQAKLTIEDIDKLYDELGLKHNPATKGNYRIMQSKGERNHSSLNLHNKDIVIFSTELDAKAVQDAKIDGVEVTQTNNSDPGRAWSVRFTDFGLVKKVLAIYATNPMNCVEK